MTETLGLIGIMILTQVSKKYIYPRFGYFGIHVFTFIMALVVVGVHQYAQYDVRFGEWLASALTYLMAAVTTYEVFLKRLGVESVASQTK